MSSPDETPVPPQPDNAGPPPAQPYGQPPLEPPAENPTAGHPPPPGLSAGGQEASSWYVPPQPPPYGGPIPADGVPPAYGGGYMPPAQPPTESRKRKWPWVLLAVSVVVVLFGCMIAMIAAIAGGSSSGFPGGDTVAVIPFNGTISGTGVGSGDITPESFLRLLTRAEEDDSVKAIVLRVDSPGGTVAASEEIAEYVKSASKPVVVSVADVDASGAYMVSSQANKIVANPGSQVGSIGVIMEIPNASAMLDKIGLEFKVITAGKYKDAGSPFRPVTPQETAMLQSQINQVYGQFIDIVASGRNLPRSKVESMATGWAWTGEEAKRMGLVDQIGTYEDAVRLAAKLGHIEGSYETEVYRDELSDVLSALFSMESHLQKISASLSADPATSQKNMVAK